jgi:hypothetical protein
MYRVHRVIFGLPVYLFALFLTENVLAQQPASNQNQKIADCLKSQKCVFQLRGEATTNPVMSFIVAKEVWESFGETDKNDLRTLLKQKIEQAKTQPEPYTDIPASAPFIARHWITSGARGHILSSFQTVRAEHFLLTTRYSGIFEIIQNNSSV